MIRIIDQITAAEANAIIAGKHYLGAVQFPPRYCFATPERDAVAIFSWPMAAAFKVKFMSLELVRLWRAEGTTVRTDMFLDRAVRRLAELDRNIDCVFTYADPAQGHTGAVYKGSGFTLVNEQTRITDAWRTPDGRTLSANMAYRELKTKAHDVIAKLRPDWECIRAVPKKLFVRPLRMKLVEIVATVGAPLPEERRKLFSKAHGGFRVSVYQERFPGKRCAACHQIFIAARTDAKTCSDRCRKTLQRRANK